ncbi:MAG TPA: hypothetical protein VM511_06080 [Luteolibacter sp.]|nr:hypothetical protein [Luteolibacter sp.]
MSSSNDEDRKRGVPLPKEPDGDGFPAEKDVSTPPKDSDQGEHPDKKR